ncbi:hypothetical protein LCGC14_0747830 [marine sediment metagenome]|uniref:Uncharacterized protein n=1 Tax=marine sediment metagenome TaxID=412755 RepID=A0A0F9SPW4_9ZZZZ
MARDYLYIFLNDDDLGVAFGDEPTSEDAIRARLGDIMILNLRTGELIDKDGTRQTPRAAKVGGVVNIHTDLPDDEDRLLDNITRSYDEYIDLVDRGFCPLCKARTEPFFSADPEFSGVIASAHCSRCGWSDNES